MNEAGREANVVYDVVTSDFNCLPPGPHNTLFTRRFEMSHPRRIPEGIGTVMMERVVGQLQFLVYDTEAKLGQKLVECLRRMSTDTSNQMHTTGFAAMSAWREAVKMEPVLIFHIGKVGYTDRAGEVLRLSVMLAGDWDKLHPQRWSWYVVRRCIHGLQKLLDREIGHRPI